MTALAARDSDARAPASVRATVVLPTYNERGTLPLLLRELAASLGETPGACEAVIVDDSSPDGTGEVAARVAAELEAVLPVTVVIRPGKAGLASAVLEGVSRARGDTIVVMDSDLSHPPETVPQLVRLVEDGADVAVGSRYVSGGGMIRWPWWRRAISQGARWLARRLLRVRIADPVSGFFAARRRLFEDVRFEGLGYKILLELLVLHPGAAVVEVPYRFTERARGRSKLGAGEITNYVRLVRRLRARLRESVLRR